MQSAEMVFFPALCTYITFQAREHLELTMHKWHYMGHGCSRAVLKFLLPRAGETRAPSEIRGEGVGAVYSGRRRAALDVVHEQKRLPSQCLAMPHSWWRSSQVSVAVLSVFVFLLQRLTCSPCPACVTWLFPTPDSPQWQLHMSKLKSLKFKAFWERSS